MDVGQFAGRFHPLLVHFPIAFLALAGVLEALAARRRRAGGEGGWLAAAVPPLLILGAASAVTAATAGYLLGTRGGYAGPTYERHLTFGLGVAIAAVLTAGAAWLRDQFPRPWLPLSRGLLALTLAMLVAAAHLGATLTHGEGYLTDYAPPALRGLVERLSGKEALPRPPSAGLVQVYPGVVQPILRRHCVECHSGEKAQGGLRLDTPEHIRAGGDQGAVLAPGRAWASEIVRRVWLPPGHEDAMPPRGRRPVSPADAAILRWWVETGAGFDTTIADLEIAPEVLPALEASLGPIPRGGPSLPPVTFPAPDPAALTAIRGRGIAIDPVAAGSPFLQVHWTRRSDTSDDELVASLAPVADHVLWLDLAGTGVTDTAYATIARMTSLTRLNVSRTATTDAGLERLTPLPYLEYLNLYGTQVSDTGVAHLEKLPKLRRLYLWQTGVTADGAQRLRTALPRLDIDLGTEGLAAGGEPPAATPPASSGSKKVARVK